MKYTNEDFLKALFDSFTNELSSSPEGREPDHFEDLVYQAREAIGRQLDKSTVNVP